jgi:tetratricopeptide (TPR) repeat protein
MVASALFTTLLESGDTTRALEVARARGWVREGSDYCTGARGRGAAEMRALVGMLVAPERTDCLLPLGRSLTDGGMVRLSRLVLLDRVRSSADPRVRREAEAFLRYRLPAHDVSKLAESLNVTGYNLQHRFGDTGGAAAAYQRAIATDPKFSWPYANLGRLYMDMDQYEVALDWLRTAVRVNPDHFRAQVNLGVTLYTLQRYDEAVPAYRAAVALHPEDAVVHADLGRSLLKLGQDGEGLRELQVAVRLDPTLTAERELLDRRRAGDPRGGPTPLAAR